MKASLPNFILIAGLIVIVLIVIGFGYDIPSLKMLAGIGFLACVIANTINIFSPDAPTVENEAWERQSLEMED